MPKRISPGLRARLKRVRLLLCDVDAVLTDGTVLIGEGFEAKQFNRKLKVGGGSSSRLSRIET